MTGDCCTPQREGNGCTDSPVQNSTDPICRSCGRKGKTVPSVTPEHLLKSEAVARLQDTRYQFCTTPTCEVVYFSNETELYFHKADLKVRVGLKETTHPIPVCYCFSYMVHDVQEEINATGTTTIPDRIRAEVKAGNCRCETENPQGTCCLGNLGRAVKQALLTVAQIVPWCDTGIKSAEGSLKVHDNS